MNRVGMGCIILAVLQEELIGSPILKFNQLVRHLMQNTSVTVFSKQTLHFFILTVIKNLDQDK